MPLDPITDHAAQAVARLLQQFRGKVRIEGLVGAIGGRAQVIEDILQGFLASGTFDIDAATGDQLDIIGDWIGQLRQGLSDTNYRKLLQARILINQCSGNADQIYEILDLVSWVWNSGAPMDIKLEDWPPASFVARITDMTGYADIIATMLRILRVAGIQSFVAYSTDAEAVRLRCTPSGLYDANAESAIAAAAEDTVLYLPVGTDWDMPERGNVGHVYVGRGTEFEEFLPFIGFSTVLVGGLGGTFYKALEFDAPGLTYSHDVETVVEKLPDPIEEERHGFANCEGFETTLDASYSAGVSTIVVGAQRAWPPSGKITIYSSAGIGADPNEEDVVYSSLEDDDVTVNLAAPTVYSHSSGDTVRVSSPQDVPAVGGLMTRVIT